MALVSILLLVPAVSPAAALEGPTPLLLRDELGVGNGTLPAPVPLLRFAQIAEAHILDDDAPAPVRREALDRVGAPFAGSQRPHEEFTDELLKAAVRGLSTERPDLVLLTGDNVDNALENEVLRLKDNLDGTYALAGSTGGLVPDGQSANVDDDKNDVRDRATALPESFKDPSYHRPLGVPWYVALGPHDLLVQGREAPTRASGEAAALSGRHFVSMREYVRLFFATDPFASGALDPSDGHGFGHVEPGRLFDADPENDGYYTFVPKPGIPVRFVVLDTVDHDAARDAPQPAKDLVAQVKGAAPGATSSGPGGSLDQAQFAWLLATIDAHPDEVVVVVAHHPAAEIGSGIGKVGGAAVVDALVARPQVAAFVSGGGAAHANRVDLARSPADARRGLWLVQTAGLVDAPNEVRHFELSYHGSAILVLSTRLRPVEAGPAIDLARVDAQRAGDAAGTPADRDVALPLSVPPAVATALDRLVPPPPAPPAASPPPADFRRETVYTPRTPARYDDEPVVETRVNASDDTPVADRGIPDVPFAAMLAAILFAARRTRRT
ncbi:MAG: metallophosphoesterase family protein [Methanobacteriota archaeon]